MEEKGNIWNPIPQENKSILDNMGKNPRIEFVGIDIPISTKQAVEQLTKALKEDPEYYYSWQATIAMQFKDEWDRVKDDIHTAEREFDMSDVHEIANNAAKNFLNLLIR